MKLKGYEIITRALKRVPALKPSLPSRATTPCL